MMMAMVHDHEELRWTRVPRPAPGPGEVLLEVKATAVNRADLLQRRGLYPPPDGASPILGLEAAGDVVEVGTGVDDELLGKRVAALLSGGGYTQLVRVPASMLLFLPDSMSYTQAAAIPEVFYTAYLNLFLEAGLQPREKALIHAAASGVGTAALQLCAMHQVEVFATASGEKEQAIAKYAPHTFIDRHSQSFREVILEQTPEGVDVILCPVGASYLEDNLKCLADRGRLVLIGLMGGTRSDVSLARLLTRRLRILGSVLRSRPLAEKVTITRRFQEDVWPYFESGALSPVIDEIFPIADAEAAHQRLASNKTVGKLVLELASSFA